MWFCEYICENFVFKKSKPFSIIGESNKNNTMSSRKPTSVQPAIKRAKMAIQKALLNPGDETLIITAMEEIKNADDVTSKKGRSDWRGDIFIVPHYSLFEGNWYCNQWKQTHWSINKMPAWAYNGKVEPNLGELVLGREYTAAPKSTER
jgi:hypothetical protein